MGSVQSCLAISAFTIGGAILFIVGAIFTVIWWAILVPVNIIYLPVAIIKYAFSKGEDRKLKWPVGFKSPKPKIEVVGLEVEETSEGETKAIEEKDGLASKEDLKEDPKAPENV